MAISNNTNKINELIDAINALPNAGSGGEVVLQEKIVNPSTSSQTVKPDTGYDGLSQVTINAITTTTQATPSISVDSSGLITASTTQNTGYVTAGTKSATKQLTTKSATTITPSTANQTVPSGTYLTGTLTVSGDSDLKAENIKSGVSIFNVLGTFEGNAGGISLDKISAITSGTYIPDSDKTSLATVTHNLGVIPNFCAWTINVDCSSTPISGDIQTGGVIFNKVHKHSSSSTLTYNYHTIYAGYSSGQYSYASTKVGNASRVTKTEFNITASSTLPIKAGYKYTWICGVMDMS